MICLPNSFLDGDTNQYDLFSSDINFPAAKSVVYPPNMANIMEEVSKPGAIKDSVNLSSVNSLISDIESITPAQLATLPLDSQQIINGSYSYSSNPSFNSYTGVYSAGLPPLISDGDSLLDIIGTLRTSLSGIPGAQAGSIGSMGSANALTNLGYSQAGNALQQNLGLSAIPDCGLMDRLMGLLTNLLQPLIDLLAYLLDPLFNLIGALLEILAAILAPLMELLNLLGKLLNFALGNTLLNIDPCGLLFLGQQASPELANEVNDGIIWNDPDSNTIPTPGQVNTSLPDSI